MKNLFARPLFGKAFVFTLLFINLFAMASKAGVDSYEIYLNNKLLFRQSLDKPLNLSDLPITEANAADKLVIHYSQCNAPGKTGRNRSIALKDAEGGIVKEWKFKDAEGSNPEMIIPVKELLEVQKNSASAWSLYYVAEGRTQGQKLAVWKGVKKSNTKKS